MWVGGGACVAWLLGLQGHLLLLGLRLILMIR